jgi:hypothetical protein
MKILMSFMVLVACAAAQCPGGSTNSVQINTGTACGGVSLSAGQLPAGTAAAPLAQDKDCYSPIDFGATQTTDLGAAWASIYTAKGNNACVTLAQMDGTHVPGTGICGASGTCPGRWIMTSNPFAGLGTTGRIRIVLGGGPVEIVTNVPWKTPNAALQVDGVTSPGAFTSQGLRLIVCHTDTVVTGVITAGGCTANGVSMSDFMAASNTAGDVNLAVNAGIWTPAISTSTGTNFTVTVNSTAVTITALASGTAINGTNTLTNNGNTINVKTATGGWFYVVNTNTSTSCSDPIASVSSASALTLQAPWAAGCPVASSGTGVTATIVWPNANAVIMDGMLGASYSNNTFAHVWTHLKIDLEGLPEGIGYWCGNCQERSDLQDIPVSANEEVFNTSAHGRVKAGYAWDGSYGSGQWPSHQWVYKVGEFSVNSGNGITSANADGPYGAVFGCYNILSQQGSDGPNGSIEMGTISGVSGDNIEAAIVIDGCNGVKVEKSHVERDLKAAVWVGPTNPTTGVWVEGPQVIDPGSGTSLVLFDTNATTGNCVHGTSTGTNGVYWWTDVPNSLNSGMTGTNGGVMGSGTGLGALDQYCQDGVGTPGRLMAGSLMDTTGTSVAKLAPNALQVSGSLSFSNTSGHILGSAGVTDINIDIPLSGLTSSSQTFGSAYPNGTRCALAPNSDPTLCGTWWVTSTASSVTAHVHTACTITFVGVCVGY